MRKLMITRITVPFLALAALLGGCSTYQAPPNGDTAYCWRVQQDRHESGGREIVFYTNIEPEQVGSLIIVRDAWFTFHQPDPVITDRYDRYTEEMPLSPDLGPITVQRRCPYGQ